MQHHEAIARRPHTRRTLAASMGVALLLGLGLSPVAQPQSAQGAEPDGAVTALEAVGTIVVYSGQAAPSDDVVAEPLPDEVRLVVENGESIAITGSGAEDLGTGTVVSAVLDVPATVSAARAGDAAAPVDADSAMGRQIVAEANAHGTALEASKLEVIAQPVLAATAPLGHTVDVAIVDAAAAPSSGAISDAEVDALVSQLSAYWAAQTGGQIIRVSRSSAIQRVSLPNPCAPEASWSAIAPLFGTTVGDYQFGRTPGRHLLVLAPTCAEGSGLGSVGSSLHNGGVTWSGYSARYGPVTVAHEMGHNLGLGHSNALDCVNPVVLSEYSVSGVQLDRCNNAEYRDLYDLMSAGTLNQGSLPSLNVTHKHALGVLGGSDLPGFAPTLGEKSAQAHFTLTHVSGTSGVRGVMVTDPRSSERYFVEYRSGTGTDAGNYYSEGRNPRYAPGVRVMQLRGNTSLVFSKPSSTSPSTVIPTDRPYFLRAGEEMTIRPGLTVGATAVSGPTASVSVSYSGEPLPMRTSVPVVIGDPRVGEQLIVGSLDASWGPRYLGFNYQWLRNGQPVAGEDWGNYTVTEADRGAALSVTVTGTLAGYATTARTSAQTAAVTPLPTPAATPTPTPPPATPTPTPSPTAAPTATPKPTPRPTAAPATWPPKVSRVSGSDRFDTAVRLSRARFSATAPVVYLVTGLNYPDALAAAPAAAKQGGPLLLTMADALPAVTAAEIKRLTPAKVVVVGGEAAVGRDVLTAVKKLSPAAAVTRIAGADRFETARKLVSQAFAAPVGTAYVATGQDYPDALSASAAAGAAGVPVILVDGNAASADSATLALLKKLAVSRLEVAGGPAAVSAGLYASLGTSVGSITRRSGADRYATSQAINNAAFGSGVSGAYLATGLQFPDALAGAAMAGAARAPLYVVQPHCVPGVVLDGLKKAKPRTVTVIGGTAALSSTVAALGRC